jgi:hypothetical protein
MVKYITVIKFVIKYTNILLQYILPFTADEVNFSKYISRTSVLPTEDYKYDGVVTYVCRCDTYCKICWLLKLTY